MPEMPVNRLPSPDANFIDFTSALPDFLPAIMDGFQCIVSLASEADQQRTGPDAVIAMLTGTLAEDLHDVTTLCSAERRNGALRLLRTPYEKLSWARDAR